MKSKTMLLLIVALMAPTVALGQTPDVQPAEEEPRTLDTMVEPRGGAPGWVAPTGYVLMSAGTVGLIAVLIRGIQQNSDLDNFFEEQDLDYNRARVGEEVRPVACIGPDADECRDLLAVDSFNRSQYLYGSLAGAALLGGAALTYWSWSADKDDSVRVSVSGQSIQVGAQF